MKARLTKLFTLLTILTLGITNVWGATSATAGTYETAKPSSGGKALDMSGGDNTVFVYRPRTGGNSSFNTSNPIGIKTTGNANGVAFYISTSMKFYATLNQKKESKNKSCDVKVYQITESLLSTIAGATSSQLSADPSGLTTTELTDYKKTVSYSSNADADPINSAEVTLPAGYYYVLAVESDGNAMYWYSITLSAAAVTKHSVTYALNGGGGTTPTQEDVAEGSKFTLHDGVTGITAPTDKEFDGWHDGTTKYAGGAEYTMGTSDVTLTAQWRDPAPKYIVTLNPDGGVIADATGWTLNGGNYEKEVAEGTVLTLPTFTKTDRAFKTWRKAGPADVASPVTVDGDLSLTAIWTATVEQVLYSWEGAEGGAIETGGTAAGNVDNLINQTSAGYYCLKIDGKADWSTNYITITLTGTEKVKTGDKIKYLGFYNKTSAANARPKMRDANSPNTEIFNDGTNLPNLNGGGEPAERTFTVPASINTNAVQITRSQTGSNTWISKLQIIREKEVAEENICTITFNSDGGSTVADVIVEKGTKATRPADPTKSGATFAGWYNGADLYDWDANVTGDLALTAHWNVSHTVTYKDGTTTLGTETVIDGNNPIEYATYEAKAHYSFNGWFNNSDLDPSHAVTIASEVITDDAIYFGKWTENAKVTVAFRVDGVDYSSSEVYVGEKATSPDSPSKAGKIFRGWFNGADKFDFTANVTAAVTLDASWDDAAPNHFQYAYNDDFHFDGVTYKTPEGKVDVGAGASNVAITTPYTLFSGAEGITSIVATKAIYDSKSNWVNAYLKLAKDDATSNLAFTIATGYTAVLTMKMGGYSNNPTVTLNDGSADVEPTSGTIGGKASTENNFHEIVYDLAAGTYTLTSASQTLYISHIDLVATPAVVPPTPDYERTGLEVGRYYTICLPKKVVAATGATFWSMSERNTDTENPLAYIVEENLPLTAGQPFLFQATATTLEVTYEGEATTAGSHGALHGTLDAMDQDALDAAAGANTLYILKNNELRLASGRTGNSLAANRAYIIYEELDPVSTPSHAPGRQVRSMPLHKDVATGLDDLNADTQAQKVILNGQLFIIRGEKMYDATGILVK